MSPERGRHRIRGRALVAAGGVLTAVAAFAVARGSDTVPPAPVAAPAAAFEIAAAGEGVVGLGRIESGRGLVTLGAPVDGVVRAVPVDVGDSIAAGAVVAELARDPEVAALASAERRLAAQRARVAAAAAELARDVARLAQAERDAGRARRLTEAGAVSAREAERAGLDHEVARREREAREAALRELHATMAELAAERDGAAARLAQRVVRAPVAAHVLRVEVLPGAAVAAGGAVAELAPLGPRVARCEVDELFAAEVRDGARAVVRAVGGEAHLARGTVRRLAPGLARKSLFTDAPAEAEDRRVREVRVELADGSDVPYNARVECVIARAGAP